MPPISWPTGTAPGVNPTETGGRLINAIAERAPTGSRSEIVWRRVAGLIARFSTTQTAIRGALLVGSVLYVVSGNRVYSITSSYVVTELTGRVRRPMKPSSASATRSPAPCPGRSPR